MIFILILLIIYLFTQSLNKIAFAIFLLCFWVLFDKLIDIKDNVKVKEQKIVNNKLYRDNNLLQKLASKLYYINKLFNGKYHNLLTLILMLFIEILLIIGLSLQQTLWPEQKYWFEEIYLNHFLIFLQLYFIFPLGRKKLLNIEELFYIALAVLLTKTGDLFNSNISKFRNIIIPFLTPISWSWTPAVILCGIAVWVEWTMINGVRQRIRYLLRISLYIIISGILIYLVIHIPPGQEAKNWIEEIHSIVIPQFCITGSCLILILLLISIFIPSVIFYHNTDPTTEFSTIFTYIPIFLLHPVLLITNIQHCPLPILIAILHFCIIPYLIVKSKSQYLGAIIIQLLVLHYFFLAGNTMNLNDINFHNIYVGFIHFNLGIHAFLLFIHIFGVPLLGVFCVPAVYGALYLNKLRKGKNAVGELPKVHKIGVNSVLLITAGIPLIIGVIIYVYSVKHSNTLVTLMIPMVCFRVLLFGLPVLVGLLTLLFSCFNEQTNMFVQYHSIPQKVYYIS